MAHHALAGAILGPLEAFGLFGCRKDPIAVQRFGSKAFGLKGPDPLRLLLHSGALAVFLQLILGPRLPFPEIRRHPLEQQRLFV